MSALTNLVVNKIFSRIEIKQPSECWPWKAACSSAGYGQIGFGRKVYYIHRLAWQFANDSQIPNGMFVLHSCDNPTCCNPNHLHLGTHQQNMIEKVERGRSNPVYGEKSGASKLTEKEVLEIRNLYAIGNYSTRKLGEKYKVSHRNIVDVVNRKIWRHI